MRLRCVDERFCHDGGCEVPDSETNRARWEAGRDSFIEGSPNAGGVNCLTAGAGGDSKKARPVDDRSGLDIIAGAGLEPATPAL
jgi:hypothetical protein